MMEDHTASVVTKVLMPVNALFGVLSILASIWMIYNLELVLWRSDRKQPVHKTVLALSICSLGCTLSYLSMVLPVVFNHSGVYESAGKWCVALGMWVQFSCVGNITWSLLLASMLLMLQLGISSSWLSRSSGAMHFVGWTLPVLGALVPVMGEGASEAYGTLQDTPAECWIKTEHSKYRLIMYAPLMITMGLSIIALLTALKSRRHYGRALRGITGFVAAFVVLWLASTVRRVLQVIHGTWDSPWLVILQQLCGSLNGVMNFLVWRTSLRNSMGSSNLPNEEDETSFIVQDWANRKGKKKSITPFFTGLSGDKWNAPRQMESSLLSVSAGGGGEEGKNDRKERKKRDMYNLNNNESEGTVTDFTTQPRHHHHHQGHRNGHHGYANPNRDETVGTYTEYDDTRDETMDSSTRGYRPVRVGPPHHESDDDDDLTTETARHTQLVSMALGSTQG